MSGTTDPVAHRCITEDLSPQVTDFWIILPLPFWCGAEQGRRTFFPTALHPLWVLGRLDSSHTLNSVSDSNLELANSWSNVLAKDKLWPVMQYGLFRFKLYIIVLTVDSQRVASVKGKLFQLMKDVEFACQQQPSVSSCLTCLQVYNHRGASVLKYMSHHIHW